MNIKYELFSKEYFYNIEEMITRKMIVSDRDLYVEGLQQPIRKSSNTSYFPFLKQELWKNYQPLYGRNIKEIHINMLKQETNERDLFHIRVKPDYETNHPLYKDGIEFEQLKSILPFLKDKSFWIMNSNIQRLSKLQGNISSVIGNDIYATYLFDQQKYCFEDYYKKAIYSSIRTKDQFSTLFLDTTAYHIKGASLALEIALSLVQLKQILKDREAFGEKNKNELLIIPVYMMISDCVLIEAAKINSFRLLSRDMLKTTGFGKGKIKLHIHGITSYREHLEKQDSNAFLSAFSGVIGGYESMEMFHHEGFSSMHESSFNFLQLLKSKKILYKYDLLKKQKDEYYGLLQMICEKAWKLFETIDNKDDFQKLLQNGFIYELLEYDKNIRTKCL